MQNLLKHLLFVSGVALGLGLVAASDASTPSKRRSILNFDLLTFRSDTDSLALPFPVQDSYDPTPTGNNSGLFLNDPENIQTQVDYNPETDEYYINQKVGEDMDYRPPTYMSFEEYQEYNANQAIRDYWREKAQSQSESQRKPLIPKLNIKSKLFETIFCGSTVEIRPQGSAELIFGVNVSKIQNPALPANQQTNTTFNFDQNIQLNVTGKIGDAMTLGVNYNTKASFDFENQMKLKWEACNEDQILRSIEAGNVSLPLTGSLISGSQNLFGVKAAMRFGRLTVTGIFSQQKSESNSVETQGGAQITKFEVKGDEYEPNRHYFLSQFFRDGYDEWLEDLPLIKSPVNITRVEVWVTNTSAQTDGGQRNIVSFMDLGEPLADCYNQTLIANGSGPVFLPNNNANNLYSQLTSTYVGARNVSSVEGVFSGLVTPYNFVNSQDYEGLEFATPLSTNEFRLHPQLGYISLTREMQPNEVLAVAFQYTYGGQVYQVGEFSTDGISGEQALYVKLLKSTVTNPKVPIWDLMMKNVYNIGAYQVSREDFRLDVIYDNISAGTRTNYITEGAINGQILLRTMSLDRLNNNNDPYADGFFDFVEGVTINSQNGRVYFPVIEPFGEHLESRFNLPDEQTIANKYAFKQLYDSTRQAALNFPELNRFILAGTYKGAGGSVISLGGMNIPQGSVKVTAGSQTLIENQDYTVDYTLGRVTIINSSVLESNQKITATFESNSLFNIQQKTLGGVHLDYVVSKDLSFGATVLNLSERPLTQKVNMGDEPINNTIWGINGNYRTESRFLTKLVDRIPLINTKEVSTITVAGEFAHLIPGNAKAITKGGIAYIDDFEGSVNFIDLKSRQSWVLASTPQGQTENSMFPEGTLTNDLGNGMNRARLAWYVIDPLFFRSNNLTPSHLTAEDRSLQYARQVLEQEIFPNRQSQIPNQQTNLPVFDVAYYPNEKGPYNYDADGLNPLGNGVASGIEPDGSLKEPETRWGGIMRPIQTSDFEANNIEFIQFWMMDPYYYDTQNTHSGGDLYFNLGNISEDILRDGVKSFENGLPTPDNNNPTDTTNLAIVSKTTNIINVFDNDPNARPYQDIGFDGLNDEQEQAFHTGNTLDSVPNSNYIDKLNLLLGPNLTQAAYDRMLSDVSSDNFKFFRGDDLDAQQASVLQRYKDFNGLENNSPTAEQSGTSFQASSSTIPDVEDINRDFTMNKSENYFQYKVSLRREDMVVGRNYITNAVQGSGTTENGDQIDVMWYQFKIPVRTPDRIVGNIQDFRSIRFMRMFFKEFEDSVIARFARLELVRGEWRRYQFSLEEPGEYIPGDPNDNTPFDISVVNIEENGVRDPVNYILPPGIERQSTPSSNTTLRQLNEQALLLKVCDLADGDARAAFKNTGFDVRSYKRLKMFVHAEAIDDNILKDDDISVFVRLGTDFDNNYYEYEVPLKVTQPGVYDQNDINDRYDVWPILNNIDIDFVDLTNSKVERNRALIADPSVSITKRYEVEHGPSNRIIVKGNPNLANIKSMIIGIRNPKKENAHDGDDGLTKCAEVWVNELRLTDFDNKGGWATTGQVNVKLADFANLNGAVDYTKFGFGAFDSKPSERKRETVTNYDLSAQIKLDKFFPAKWAINVPMYLGYGESFGTPEFNPLDPDITMAATLSALNETSTNPDSARKAITRQTERYNKRRSLNFTDIRIGLAGKKAMPWDPKNFGFNYAYNQDYMRDINTQYRETRTYRGGMNYDYGPTGKNVKPFSKLKLVNAMVDATKEHKEEKHAEQKTLVDSLKRAQVKGEPMKEEEDKLERYAKQKENYKKWSRQMLASGWWKPIKDFNFNYLPNRLGFRTDMDRRYTEQQLRNTTDFQNIKIDSTFQKSFLWNRSYHFKYDLTSAIKIQFDAFNFGRIDEPEGPVDRKFDNWDHMRDSIWSNIIGAGDRNFGGRTTQYNHTTTINWNLPINKFPILSWVTSTASYAGNYTWNAAPLERQDNGSFTQSSFGNTVQNSQNWQLNTNANLTQLYNMVPFLKKINQESRKSADARKAQAKGKSSKDGSKDEQKDSTEVKDKPNLGKIFGENVLSFLMMLKSVNVTYSENNGTMLPGYRPRSEYMGLDDQMSNMGGFVPFIFGWQDKAFDDIPTGYDIRSEAIRGNWITNDTLQSSPLTQTQSSSMNIRATVEPIKGFKIDLTATRTYSESISEFFRWDEALQRPESFNQVTTGSFSMSYITVNTTFLKPRADNSSPVFDEFKTNRLTISQRLASEYPGFLTNDSEGYAEGYGKTQQEVLIPAFLSAYGVYTPEGIDKTPFPRVPLPNWRVNYDGLGKIPFVKKFAKNVTLGHSYRSTYSVSNFRTNLAFEAVIPGESFSNTRDSAQNWIPQYQIGTITISEQFSPLVSLDINFKNSLTAKFEVKTSRTLSFNFSNLQLSEVTSEEYIVGAGYTFKNVPFPIKFGKGTKRIKSDMVLRLDFSLRDSRTMIRKMEEDLDQATSGQKLISIKVNADYVINQRFNIRLFYDAAINTPVVSSSFPTQNHAAGLSLRFTLNE